MTDLTPPADLPADVRSTWNEALQQLMAAGVHGRTDPNVLRAYAEAVTEHRRASSLIARSDVLIDRDGKPVPNPAITIRDQAARTVATLSRQLGLNRPPRPMQTAHATQNDGRWCDQHNRQECSSPTKTHGICHNPRVLGLGRCKMHAGVKISESPAHLLALQERSNPLAGQPLDIGPAEALLWRVRILSGEVARLDELVAGLERDELVYGVIRETETAGSEFPGSQTVKGARLSMWLIVREQREKVLHSACEAALRANIEERIVRLAEQQGAVLHRLIVTVLGDLGIPADDPRVGEVVPRRLRELSA